MEQYRIIKALSGFYYVQTEDGVVECRARGRFRRQDQSPLVGDFVRITRQGAGKGAKTPSSAPPSPISTSWSCWPPAPCR